MPFVGHLRPSERHLRVRHFGGPRGFRDSSIGALRVAHITDQHVGKLTSDALQQAAISATNAAKPDFVLLTGDYVAHDLDHLEQLQGYLAGLDAPAYAVLGNHDYWTGSDEVVRVLERANVGVLRNQWTQVRAGSGRMQIVGLDDPVTGHDDLELATRGLDPTLPTIALSHLGESADALWANGANLVLSGHTHSGQISVGSVMEIFLSRVQKHRYVHGLYGCRDEEQYPGTLYVSAGIGSSRFSPRIGERAQPEVAVFDLANDPDRDAEHFDERSPLREPTR